VRSPVKIIVQALDDSIQDFSSSSPLKPGEVSLQSFSQENDNPDENKNDEFAAVSRKGRKRRSITEIAKSNPLSERDLNSKNIYFETDL